MSMEHIRKSYGIDVDIGDMVEYDDIVSGRTFRGEVTGERNDRLLIRMYGSEESIPLHPTWQMRIIKKGSQT